MQRGATGEAGVPLCPHCGSTHGGAAGRLGAAHCPVWQAANAVAVREDAPECAHCADREIPGCPKCLPPGARLEKRERGGRGAKTAVPVLPGRVRAPWVSRLPPHTLTTMVAVQEVADAAAADPDLGLRHTSGRFTPQALLACALLAEVAAEAQLKRMWQLQQPSAVAAGAGADAAARPVASGPDNAPGLARGQAPQNEAEPGAIPEAGLGEDVVAGPSGGPN